MEQARGQWRHADAVNPQDHLRRFQLTQTALASRGTARISGYRLQLEDCDPNSLERRVGSGQLSSSTRLVTARHVTAPIQDQISVYFESSFDIESPTHNGIFTADADSNGHPIVYFDREYTYHTKFNTREENPLLANRFAQLGLEKIQLNNSDGGEKARNYVRGPWNFIIDEEDFPGVFQTDRVLDITVLTTTPHWSSFTSLTDTTNWNYLESGSFPMTPGIFFDYKKFGSIQHMTCPEDLNATGECPVDLKPDRSLWPTMYRNTDDERVSDLWLLHHNFFPYDRSNIRERPFTNNLISNPFPYISGASNDSEKGFRHRDELNTADYLAVDYCLGPNELHTLKYGDQFAVALDVLSGSSGGALIQADRSADRGRITENRSRLLPTAIVGSADVRRDEDLQRWGLPVGIDDLNTHSVWTTAVNDHASSWSGRDGSPDDDDPFNPTPIHPPDLEEPRCAVWSTDSAHRKCLVYETSLAENNAVDDVPDDLDFHEWTDGSGDSQEESSNGWRRVLCTHSHPDFSDNLEINAGIGVGFIGSLRYAPGKNVAGPDSSVGYLKMICAPWSTVPFVTNWPFLRHTGSGFRTTFHEDTNASHPQFLFPWSWRSLADVLVNMAEFRHDFDDQNRPISDSYLRPISMKTCPPNYFLNGIRYHYQSHPTGDGRVFAGITSLICARSTKPPENEEIPATVERSLYLPADESCPFTMGLHPPYDDGVSRCFSQSQYIGWPRTPSVPVCTTDNTSQSCRDRHHCPRKKVASGFIYQSDDQGYITAFNLDCIEEPS